VDRHTLSDGKQKEWEKKRGKYTQTAAGMKRQCFLPHKNMCYIKRQFSWIIHRKLVTTLYYNVIFPWKHEQAETHLLLWPSWWTWRDCGILATDNDYWYITLSYSASDWRCHWCQCSSLPACISGCRLNPNTFQHAKMFLKPYK
jgi:hypothetical protein